MFIESWGETVLRPDLYANADYYLLQPANLFGIAWCAGGLVAGVLLARLLAFLLLDGHFAAADEAVNAKLNQESRRSSQRTGEMTDVRLAIKNVKFMNGIPSTVSLKGIVPVMANT